MKKNILLFISLIVFFMPMVVKADWYPQIYINCDKDTLEAGEETVCRVSGTGDPEGRNSLNSHGVTFVDFTYRLSEHALTTDGTTYSSDGWKIYEGLAGGGNYNIAFYNVNTQNTSPEIFTFKVKANSVSEDTVATVNLSNILITAKSMEEAYQYKPQTTTIYVKASSDADQEEENPSTGDNILYLVGGIGLLVLGIGIISVKKLKRN